MDMIVISSIGYFYQKVTTWTRFKRAVLGFSIKKSQYTEDMIGIDCLVIFVKKSQHG